MYLHSRFYFYALVLQGALLFHGCAADTQRIIVRQNDANNTQATVDFYENEHRLFHFHALVGRNGIAAPDTKQEGDGKTPSGIYPITQLFAKKPLEHMHMPFRQIDTNLLCIDDSRSQYYNQLIDASTHTKDYTSFETMQRTDGLYEFGAVIGYNEAGVKGKGSCIFLHIMEPHQKPTAGCVSLSRDNLQTLLRRLDYRKKPTIEIIPPTGQGGHGE